jgi:hypothetical protein
VPSPGEKTILGYYTLSALAIDLLDLPPDTARKLPSYPNVRVTLLGLLAVDRRHAGQGLGELLLMDALHRCLTQSSQIAAVAVVVDAIDANAVRFYSTSTSYRFRNDPIASSCPCKPSRRCSLSDHSSAPRRHRSKSSSTSAAPWRASTNATPKLLREGVERDRAAATAATVAAPPLAGSSTSIATSPGARPVRALAHDDKSRHVATP